MPKLKTSVKKNLATNTKDIRSFLTFKPKTKEKEVPKLDLSDDDVIPESPDVQIKNKKKESRKKRVFDDSSDEEFQSDSRKKVKKEDDKKPTKTKEKKPEKPLKEVKATDMFGNGPIKRTEPIVKKEKAVKTELGIHDDEEFEKSLLEIDSDAVDKEIKMDTKEKSPQKIDNKEEIKSKFFNGKSPKKSPKMEETITNLEKESKEKSAKMETYKIPKTKSRSEHDSINNNKEKNKEEKDDKNSDKSNSKSDKNHSKSEKEKDSSKTEKESSRTEKKSSKSRIERVTELKKDSHKSDKKRDFSEFINEDDAAPVEDLEEDHEPKNKRKKGDTSMNTSVLSDEERFERRRHSAALYQNYLNRSGPKHLGSKSIPEGTPNCLKECAFLLTGVLDSFERDEVADAIKNYGGLIKNGISKKVTHVLAGDDAGPAKIAKAKDLGIKILNEDEFLDMITELSGKGSKKSDKSETENKSNAKEKDKKSKSSERERDSKPKSSESKRDKTPKKTKDKLPQSSEDKMKAFEDKIKSSFYGKSKDKSETSTDKSDNKEKSDIGERNKNHDSRVKEDVVKLTPQSSSSSVGVTRELSTSLPNNSIMWVDKYKPTNIKQIIGQHGDASNVKKLMNWLTKWYVNRKAKLAKPSPWAKNDDGAYFKAALLSGPPGVGKTTTVSLVCKELGFDTVEFNASDTRSKSLIKEQIGDLLSTTSLSAYAKGNTGKQAVTKKHVLVMDEVDGMAGNEDRGGLQELISLIKSSSVPVICMCNDRSSDKMRTLVNYCYDLKFSRPRVDQIKSAMLSICCKEKIKIHAEALTQLIAASNQDVRQTLNSLSLWAIDPARDVESLKKDADNAKKDTRLGPWEVIRKVFSAEDHKSMSIMDKSDLFFYDYSIAPLFVQENYLSVTPHCPKNEILSRVAEAADSLSLGETIEAKIRTSQAWNLLPYQAILSSVTPGALLSGHVSAQIQFPSWLGRNSRRNKMKRLAQEIHAHARLSATGSKTSIHLDYAKSLRDAIVTPLIKDRAEGVTSAVSVLSAYHLLREDLDSLTELSLWPGQRDPMLLVDSKVKAAMTRAYNKQSPALPHAAASFTKGRGRAGRGEDGEGVEGEGEEREDSEPDSDPEKDGLIKVKKKASSTKQTKETKPSTSKGEKGKKGKAKK